MNATFMSLLRQECGIHVVAAGRAKGRAEGRLPGQYGQLAQYAVYA
jgi:hypothetical protein